MATAARERHPRAIRWMHWINFPVLFVMAYSGLRIYWANDVYAAGILGWEIFAFFPERFYEALDVPFSLARGMAFHFTFGWFFAVNGLIYVLYLAISGQWRHLVPDRRSLSEAVAVFLHDLRLRRDKPAQGRYNAAQKIAYTTVIVLAAIVVLSGFAILKPTQATLLTTLMGGYEFARFLHFAGTIGLMAFFLVHVLQVARAGWRNLLSMITGYERVDTPEPTPDDAPEREEVPA